MKLNPMKVRMNAVIAVLLVAAAAPAQNRGQFELTWSTVDGGGGTITGGAYVLNGTIAQADAGAEMTGGGFALSGGFWPGLRPVPPCEGDANGDGAVDPLDSGYVLARFGCPVGTGDPFCDAADVNGDGDVDPLDSGYVLARFGPCPL